jgi:hypothetical protein
MKTTDYWYSKVFIVIVLALFLIPSVTFAAWYNPFTWQIWSIFKKSDAPVVVQVETISTSSPSVSTSTEPKKDVAPETQKKTVSTPVQPKAEPIVVTQSLTNAERDGLVDEIVAQYRFIESNRNAKNNALAELKEDQSVLSKNTYGDFDFALLVINDTIAFVEGERAIDQMYLDRVGNLDSDQIETYYDTINLAFAEWSKLNLQYHDDTEIRSEFIHRAIDDGYALSKLRIEKEVIDEVFAPYRTGSQSLSDIKAEQKKLSEEADAFLKNLATTQEKLRGDSKEKVDRYLKVIIYSPIGNSGWLNSR